MFPLTYSINKQLLPIFDKPMFYYPLSLMMLCGIKEYIFVINKGQEANFRKLLGNPNDLGIKISFVSQESPRGLPDAFLITKELPFDTKIFLLELLYSHLIFFGYCIIHFPFSFLSPMV